jgi:hypothetical protein
MIQRLQGFSKVGAKCCSVGFSFGKVPAEMLRPVVWPIFFLIYALQSR